MMSKRRISILFFVLTLVVLAAVGGWLAGSTIQSPAEVAARTAPPPPSPILVPIEERVLTSDVVTRGTARYGLPQSISIVPSALKPNAGVITTLPSRKTQLQEGSVLLTASGRPVFVLQGEIPVYRDLVPGSSGDDVRQLEDGLKRLGFDPGPIDGTYDERTSAAVATWYSSADWQPFGATDEQRAAIRTLEQKLAGATNIKLAADDAVAGASLAIEAARANAESARQSTAAAVAEKTVVRDRVMADPHATEADRANARMDLMVAQATARAAQLGGKAATQAAVNAQKAAERDARTADAVAAQLAADLELARFKAGVQVPADELVFLAPLPVRVEKVDVGVGDAASGTVMAVTNNQLAIDSSLPLDEAPLVRPGMPVVIDEPDLGVKATGVVAQVADTPGTDGVDGYHIYFEILVDTTSATLEGFSLRLTIPVKSTGAKVTVVPVSALSLAADGTTRLQVDNNGSLEYILVQPGLAANGFVEVTPVGGTLTPGQLVVIGYENNS
jgi:peptidoglycan hydrolase-like protein with peptidoglycan-binding domain